MVRAGFEKLCASGGTSATLEPIPEVEALSPESERFGRLLSLGSEQAHDNNKRREEPLSTDHGRSRQSTSVGMLRCRRERKVRSNT